MSEEAVRQTIAERKRRRAQHIDRIAQTIAFRLQSARRIESFQRFDAGAQKLAAAIAVGVLQLLQIGKNAIRLKAYRAWVGAVEDEQIEYRQPFRARHVARAIGDNGVGQAQQPDRKSVV